MKLTRHHGWPLGILGALIFIATLLLILFQLSRTVYPVESDRMFISDYQHVNEDYDNIIAQQQAFDSHYHAEIITHQHSPKPIVMEHVRRGAVPYDHALNIGTNRFYVTLTDHEGNPIKEANLKALVTRYDTDQEDVYPGVRYDEQTARYHFGPFETISEGRYKILVRIEVDNETGHLEKSVFAR
jgi:hypothetical protein